ncbi:MAG: RagB/SusD family nutrient uptake outer membrane protein [Ferruginibacter sp.]
MMYKRILFIMIVITGSGIIGCKKDPSTVSNPGVYDSNSYPRSIDELTSVLAAGYGNLRVEGLYGFQLLPKTFASCEHISNHTDGTFDYTSAMIYNNLTSSNKLASQIWSALFVGVKDANAALDRADFYQAKYMGANELQQVNVIRGEAYFLRAWYYFMLENFFGESYISQSGGGDKKGVPIFTTVPQSLEEMIKPRATSREVWDLIISDLKKADTLLQGSSNGTGDKLGRVTSWTAKALLGKAYVFTQDWANAKLVLKDVIDNSGKTLMPFNIYQQAFNSNVFPGVLNTSSDQEFNNESLFELNVDRVPQVYGIFGGVRQLTTSQGLLWAPTGFSNNGLSRQSMGYGNMCMNDRALRRFGFDIPVDSTADNTLLPNPAYNPNPAPNPTPYVSTQFIPGAYYTQRSADLRNNKIADPRLYVCAMEPYFDTVYFSSLQGQAGDRKKRPVAKHIYLPITDQYQGWSLKKYQTLDSRMDDITQADGANYYLLRLADVFLLYAEACMNSGDPVNALEYINKVHRRAYSGNPAYDYSNLSAATKADPSDINLANNPLAYERFTELFAEGQWWFDVCRWRIGQQEATYFGNLLPNNIVSQWSDGRSYSFPIPLAELNANAAMAGQQNPGY